MDGMDRRFALVGRAAIALACLAALAACEGVKEELGLTKTSPDEFTVVRKAPLVLPPNFTLRPPDPGSAGPREIQPSQTARASLLNGGDGNATSSAGGDNGAAPVDPGNRSGGEVALLEQAGALGADGSIRQVINRETTVLAEKDRSFTDRLIFWQKAQPPGTVVDPTKESQRLRDNAATGEPVTKGETPVIERRKRGILEGIF
jgi:hypothetical protein